MAIFSLLSLSLLAWLAQRGRGYVIVNSVSWAVTNQEEPVSAEEEEEEGEGVDVLPNRLFESSSSIWKAGPYPAAAHQQKQQQQEDAELPSPKEVLSFPSRMFSYRREGLAARAPEQQLPPEPSQQDRARRLLHSSNWGFLATLSSLDKIKGMPFGNIFPISDGLVDNGTGIPFLCVSPVDPTVVNLMNNPSASLTLPEAETDYCRQNLIEFEDSRCARLTLTGQVVTVPTDEIQFAKQAMFSRHPVMKKWPPDHNCFFMKMNIEQAWLQDWFGGVTVIPLEDYFKANPANVE